MNAPTIRSHVRGVLTMSDLSPVAEFAALRDLPDAFKMVDGKCSQCDAPISVPFCSQHSCACTECREKWEMEQNSLRYETRWEMDDLCPPGSVYRTTDPKHPDFPRANYEATRAWRGGETLVFIGPSGTGKTRLGMHLLKRCLFSHGLSVAALWPEDLRHHARSRDARDALESYCRVDVLLLDDPFLTGYSDERIGEFLISVLDRRARLGHHHVITTQFGGTQYREAFMAHVERFDRKPTSQDWARFDALFRRVRENSRTIVFGDAPAPVPGVSGERELDF